MPPKVGCLIDIGANVGDAVALMVKLLMQIYYVLNLLTNGSVFLYWENEFTNQDQYESVLNCINI